MRKRARRRFLAFAISLPGVMYALLWNFAQVSPDEAKKNLKAWSPGWLASRWALAAVLGFTACSYLWFFRKGIWNGFRALLRHVRVIRFQSPFYLKQTREAELVNARITAQREADARVLKMSEFMERAQAEKMDAQDQLASARQALVSAQYDARQRFEVIRYGRVLLDPHQLDSHDFAAMLNSLHELKVGIRTLQNGAQAVWVGLVAQARETDSYSPIGRLSSYVGRYDKSHAATALDDLVASLDARKDPRPLLAGAYVAYREWRALALHLSPMVGNAQIADMSDYQQWYAAEVGFFSELQRKLAIPLLGTVKRVIDDYDAEHKPMSDLLPAPMILSHPSTWAPLTVPDPLVGNRLPISPRPGSPDAQKLAAAFPLATRDLLGSNMQPELPRYHVCDNPNCKKPFPVSPSGTNPVSSHGGVHCPECHHFNRVPTF